MNSADLFRAIGAVEEKDLEQAQRKNVTPFIWIAAAAAVLLLLLLLIHREVPLSHNVLEEKASWNMDADIHVMPEQLKSVNITYAPLRFTKGLTVHARLVKALPDTYVIPEKTLSRDNYRVLQLETVEAVAGKDVPKEFWFLLPERYAAALGGLDLLINMDQVGVENYLLFNSTQQQYETFSLMFSAGVYSHEQEPLHEFIPDPTAVSTDMGLAFLPFKNGSLCWPETDAWADLAETFDYFSAKENSPYPIAPNTTLKEAKAAVRQARKDGPLKDTPETRVRHANEYNIGIDLNGFNTPKKGVFSQIIHHQDKKVLVCRIVDGFYTNECYMYYEDGRIEEGDVKFTQEEIAALPKLAPIVEQVLEKAPEKGTCHEFIGYYYKTDNGDLIGVVRAVWEINWETDLTVNMLVKSDGTVCEVSTEALEACLRGETEIAQLN